MNLRETRQVFQVLRTTGCSLDHAPVWPFEGTRGQGSVNAAFSGLSYSSKFYTVNQASLVRHRMLKIESSNCSNSQPAVPCRAIYPLHFQRLPLPVLVCPSRGSLTKSLFEGAVSVPHEIVLDNPLPLLPSRELGLLSNPGRIHFPLNPRRAPRLPNPRQIPRLSKLNRIPKLSRTT